MPEISFPGGQMLVGDFYKPGDQAPSGYLNWHDWAAIQHKAGLRQQECGRCGLWRYPQELSGEVASFSGHASDGTEVTGTRPICNKCVALTAPLATGQVT